MNSQEKLEPEIAAPPKANSYDNLPPTRVVPESELVGLVSKLAKLEAPGYRIGKELGRGGMSVVFQAEHIALQRTVAIKMLLPGLEVPESVVARFRAEAEALAKLSHPNIIQIYEVGQTSNIPYIVLEYCPGGNLHQALRGKPSPSDDAAKLLEQLARGMAAAHKAGIVHRDLKPANILFQLDGTPKITDFGLAKDLESDHQRTKPEAILGTPCYMAPEQASRKHSEVGPGADVYALGVVLYEMLTGRPPFHGPTELDTLLQVIHEEPVRLRQLQRRIPRDLETICLKCLEKEPNKRYQTATELADDLGRYRQGMPIIARPVGPVRRLAKMMRRYPVVSALSATLAVVIVGLGIAILVSWVQTGRALQAKNAEVEAKDRALANGTLLLADAAWRNHDAPRANYYLGQIKSEFHAWEWSLYSKLTRGGLFTLSDPAKAVKCLALSGDGKYLAAGSREEGPNLFVWEAATGKLLHKLQGPTFEFPALAFHPSQPVLASAGADSIIKLWNPETGKLIRSLTGHKGPVFSVVFHPDGKMLISSAADKTIRFWDVASGDEIPDSLIKSKRVLASIALSPDGKTLVGGGDDTAVHVWDLVTRTLRTLEGHTRTINYVTCSPDGSWIGSGDLDGGIRVWRLKTGELHLAFHADSRQIYALCFSPDGKRLASAGGEKLAVIRSIATGEKELVLAGHGGTVSCALFTPDGRRLITGSLDHTVKVWDAQSQPATLRYYSGTKPINAFAFSPDEKVVVCGGEDKDLELISLSGSRTVSKIPFGEAGVRSLAFSATGESLACLTRSGLVMVLGRAEWKSTGSISCESPIEAMAWVKDKGELRYLAGKDTVRVGQWGGGTPHPQEHVLPVVGPLGPVDFSDDGKYLALEKSGEVHVFQGFPPKLVYKVAPASLKIAQLTNIHQTKIHKLAISNQGCLAIGFERGIFWCPLGLAEAFRFELQESERSALDVLTFVSNGERLLSKWGDQTLHSWDARSDQLLTTQKTPPGQVATLAVSPSGKHVVFATSGGAVLGWDSSEATDGEHRRFLMSAGNLTKSP